MTLGKYLVFGLGFEMICLFYGRFCMVHSSFTTHLLFRNLKQIDCKARSNII